MWRLPTNIPCRRMALQQCRVLNGFQPRCNGLRGLRFYSEKPPAKDNNSKGDDESSKDDEGSKDSSSSVPSQRNSADVENFSPDMSSKVSKPKGSLPAMDPSIAGLMNRPQTEYDPLEVQDETTYEYHAPKAPKQKARDDMKERARGGSKLKRMLPSLICGTLFVWGCYTYKYMTQDTSDRDEDGALLRDDKFLPYLISFKYQIDDDHYLIELTRKNRAQKLIHNQHLFDGKTMWSVEIAKPDINIVRSYTPLPVFVAGINPDTEEPHLRLVSQPEQEGKFTLIVKRYPDGEFSKWLTGLEMLSEVGVRGPNTDYKLPFHPLDHYKPRPQLGNTLASTPPDPEWPQNKPLPENFVFFGAGTGILPLLQIMYSPNPPKGFFEAFISMRKKDDLLPQLRTLNYFAEKCGRAKFHYFFDDEDKHLTAKDIPYPTLPNFTGVQDMKISEEAYRYKLLQEKKAEVKRQIENGGKDTSASASTSTSDESSQGVSAATKTNSDYLEGASNEENISTNENDLKHVKADNAYQQWNFLRFRRNSSGEEDSPAPSFAFACGPDGYLGMVCGKPDLNNKEGVDTAPISGLLSEKGWTTGNVKRMSE